MTKIYMTLRFNQGFSCMDVWNYLKGLGVVGAPSRVSDREHTWRLTDLSVEDVLEVMDWLPVEWPLTDAFVSDRRGKEVW